MLLGSRVQTQTSRFRPQQTHMTRVRLGKGPLMYRSWVGSWVLASLAVGCNNTEYVNPGPGPTGPTGPICAPSQTPCGDVCVTLQADSAHCGTCFNSCPVGTVCSLSICSATCDAGLALCETGCVDVQTNPANCGACGVPCGPGQSCESGVCTGPIAEVGGGCGD